MWPTASFIFQFEFVNRAQAESVGSPVAWGPIGPTRFCLARRHSNQMENPVTDLIPPEGATEAQIDTFLASLREDAGEHVRELLAAGAPEVEVSEFMASLEPFSTDAISADGGER
jgi:hypothetical protein